MKGSDIFGGNSLKAEDIRGKEPVVTIDGVDTKKFEDGPKAIIKFRNTDKVLICNRTNWNSIVEITGEEDSDNWTGHRIKLIVARVDFQGRRTDAIRVDPPPSTSTKTKPKPKPVEPELDTPVDDEPPF